MPETITEKIYQTKREARPNAATRNVDVMALELAVNGFVSPETQAMVLDEELTHAAEVLVAQEKAYGAIPRTYFKSGNDLVDIHTQSLRKVFSDGIEYSEMEMAEGVPGADWELERRKAELNNLETILAMEPGTACIEISASPFDKPEAEQLAQHYNGLTMIRLSIEETKGKITQYNYALPLANPEFALAVARKLGHQSSDDEITSLNLLANPIIQKIDQGELGLVKEVDNLIGAAMLETAVGHSAVRMISRAIAGRREAWDFVNSDQHGDLHNELLAGIEYAARLNPDERQHAMAAIRSGFWKEFKDRFNDRRSAGQVGGIIAEAASRAVADGDVFIACGSTVTATQMNAKETAATRAATASSLLKEVKGSGKCSACRASGVLYGCGIFCGHCNQIWCNEYKRSGKQLSAKEIALQRFRNPISNQKQPGGFDLLAMEWNRIGQEIQKKRMLKLRQEQELAKAA